VFKFDPNYLDNEARYQAIKVEILGEGSDEESGSDDDESEDDEGSHQLILFGTHTC
jgi:pre-mRNA-splicing factor CWC22